MTSRANTDVRRKIQLSESHAIDLDLLVDTRLLIQANSGGGKSYLIRRLLEQSHGRIQHLVIDPEGEFATLRERFDYVLAARRGGDTAADPRMAKLLAERLLELGASAILDIYELARHERIRFVRGFLEALVDAPKKLWHPVLIVVDEAHVFCPQHDEAESATAVIDLATRGRKRGFCAVLATQRIAKLHKDAAAECNNKLIGRTGLDVDVKRAGDELGFTKERWRELRELEPGRFFGFGPAISRQVVALGIGPVQTTHPEAGSRIAAAPPPPAREKIRALLPRLADLPAEAEQRQKTADDLRREVTQLRKDLAAAKKAAPAVPPAPAPSPGPSAAQVRSLRTTQRRLEELHGRLEKLNEQVLECAAAVDLLADPPRPPIPPAHAGGKPAPAPAMRPTAGRDDLLKRYLQIENAGSRVEATFTASSGVTVPQQRILDALAWLESVGLAPAERSQIALLADQSPTSSGYANNLGSLRTAGMIEYPAGGRVGLTAEGRAIARAGEVPATDEELQRQVLGKLPRPQARILTALIESFPNELQREALAEAADQSPSSSGYANNLGRLRALGLIDYPARGAARAAGVLFPNGAAS
jgi:hypothetical protein